MEIVKTSQEKTEIALLGRDEKAMHFAMYSHCIYNTAALIMNSKEANNAAS